METIYQIINPNGISYDWAMLVIPAVCLIGSFLALIVEDHASEKQKREVNMPKKKPLKVTITISDKPYTKAERYRRWDMAIGDGYRAYLLKNADKLLEEYKKNG